MGCSWPNNLVESADPAVRERAELLRSSCQLLIKGQAGVVGCSPSGPPPLHHE